MGHSYGTLLWDTLVGHCCGTCGRHSYGTLLWDTLVGYSCRTLLWDTLVGHSCGTLLLQKSRCEAARRAFRTRLPPKVTRQVSKTSVSYETSSKSHTSSLPNERFVRDFLQKSRCEAARRAFRTRLPPKVTRQVSKTSVSHETSSKSPAETPIRAHTSRSAAKQFRDSSPSKRHPLTRQSQCDSDIHLYHNSQPPDSLRLPRIFPRPHV